MALAREMFHFRSCFAGIFPASAGYGCAMRQTALTTANGAGLPGQKSRDRMRRGRGGAADRVLMQDPQGLRFYRGLLVGLPIALTFWALLFFALYLVL